MLEAAIGRHAWRLRDVTAPTTEQLRQIVAEDLTDEDLHPATPAEPAPVVLEQPEHAEPAVPEQPETPEHSGPAVPKDEQGETA
jgi:hypothetical protein